MYCLTLIEDDPSAGCTYHEVSDCFDKRFSLNSCIKAGYEEFNNANADNPNLIGYGIGRKLPDQDIGFDYIHIKETIRMNKREYSEFIKELKKRHKVTEITIEAI